MFGARVRARSGHRFLLGKCHLRPDMVVRGRSFSATRWGLWLDVSASGASRVIADETRVRWLRTWDEVYEETWQSERRILPFREVLDKYRSIAAGADKEPKLSGLND